MPAQARFCGRCGAAHTAGDDWAQTRADTLVTPRWAPGPPMTSPAGYASPAYPSPAYPSPAYASPAPSEEGYERRARSSPWVWGVSATVLVMAVAAVTALVTGWPDTAGDPVSAGTSGASSAAVVVSAPPSTAPGGAAAPTATADSTPPSASSPASAGAQERLAREQALHDQYLGQHQSGTLTAEAMASYYTARVDWYGGNLSRADLFTIVGAEPRTAISDQVCGSRTGTTYRGGSADVLLFHRQYREPGSAVKSMFVEYTFVLDDTAGEPRIARVREATSC